MPDAVNLLIEMDRRAASRFAPAVSHAIAWDAAGAKRKQEAAGARRKRDCAGSEVGGIRTLISSLKRRVRYRYATTSSKIVAGVSRVGTWDTSDSEIV